MARHLTWPSGTMNKYTEHAVNRYRMMYILLIMSLFLFFIYFLLHLELSFRGVVDEFKGSRRSTQPGSACTSGAR